MHVDGAYGGPALFADDLRPSFAGIERADSVAFDPHKWLYTPLAGGCVVVRRMADLAESFDADASYIVQDKEYTQHGLDLGRHGPQFSRSFWALKVWVSLLAHGRRAYARRISHDAALARYLGARAEERPEFELAAPVGLSICCFRYVPPDLPEGAGRDGYLDDLNHRLMTEIQLDGRVYISNAVLGRAVRAPRVHRELPHRGRRHRRGPRCRRRARSRARRRAAAGGVGRCGVSAFGLLGSGEFEPWSAEVDRVLLAGATGDGRVLILPAASAKEGDGVFDGWGSKGLAHFASLGVPAEVVPIKTREDAARDDLVAKVEGASVAYFSGGNPAFLASVLADTPFWDALRGAMGRGLAYIGCSAGVACLGDQAPDSDALRFADGVWQPGLGVFHHTWFGPHWDAVDRFVPGLSDFIVSSVPPGDTLFAIDENTAAVGDGEGWSVKGAAGVHIYRDGGWAHHAAGSTFSLDLGRDGG